MHSVDVPDRPRPAVDWLKCTRDGAHPLRGAGRGLAILCVGVALFLQVGCAGPGPELFPIAPFRIENLADGLTQRWYDVDGNGRPDFCEWLPRDERITRIGYDRDEDNVIDDEVDLLRVPPEELHHLVIILDSIPYGMVAEIWDAGRLRYCHHPTRVISPFPVMTDPCLTEFFGLAPCPAVESEYFDGETLRSGYLVYASNGNTPWHAGVDYFMDPVAHAVAYLHQYPWYDHELRRMQGVLSQRRATGHVRTVCYSVGSSALGARIGRNGHEFALIRLDRFCQQIIHQTRGRVRISLLSDHGHNLMDSRRIALRDELVRLGYRAGATLRQTGDIVMPEFGMVTFAGIHTREPHRVAHDVVMLTGMELAAYGETDGTVVVVGRNAEARITRIDNRFRYEPVIGDPLQLRPILDQLAGEGKVHPDGSIDDRVLFEATNLHIYPDPLYRLWRAFHGLFKYRPDVFVSVCDGYQVGSPAMSRMVRIQAAHGNLRELSSCGFAATMAGELPPIIRMIDLRSAFHQAGVPLYP